MAHQFSAEVFVLNKIRVKFTKGDKLKFISHLDMLKMFDRALRRAHIPIIYSQGFNPHPKIEFALPLSVGVTSDSEYADFEVEETYSPLRFKNELNAVLPEGISITEASKVETSKSLMSLIVSASYFINITFDKKTDEKGINEVINDIMNSTDISVSKKSKAGIKKVNIRPMIYKLWNGGSDSEYCNTKTDSYRIGTLLSAGSRKNLNPITLKEVFMKYFGERIIVNRIHRNGLYVDTVGRETPIKG